MIICNFWVLEAAYLGMPDARESEQDTGTLLPCELPERLVLLTFANDLIVIHNQLLFGNEDILHLFQQLWTKMFNGARRHPHEGHGRTITATCVWGASKAHFMRAILWVPCQSKAIKK